MKNIFIILLLVFCSCTSTNYQKSNIDSFEIKENYIGFNYFFLYLIENSQGNKYFLISDKIENPLKRISLKEYEKIEKSEKYEFEIYRDTNKYKLSPQDLYPKTDFNVEILYLDSTIFMIYGDIIVQLYRSKEILDQYIKIK